jgi:hypothetical protein
VSGGRALVRAGAVLTLTACDGGAEQACPAVAWSNGLTVALAGDWPPGEGRTVRVGCPQPCGLDIREDTPPGPVHEGVAPLTGATAALSFVMATPDEVDVTVLGPDRTVLAGLSADLEWARVGGSAECGGPHEATVTVPAP